MKDFSQNTIRWIFICFGTIFFCFYLSLFVYWSDINNSPAVQFDSNNLAPELLILGQPDYAANYNAIRATFFERRATIFEPLTFLSLSQVHPRSTTVIQSRITPIGFPGVIVLLSGIIHFLVFLFGFSFFNLLLIAIVPIIAAITPRLFYEVLKPIFGKRVSLLSALSLYSMPVWWYYAHWPLQHHTLIIFFFLAFLYTGRKSIRTPKKQWKKRVLFSTFAGLSFALCIYLRPSESIWLFGVLIALLIQLRKKIAFYSGILPFFALASFVALFFFVTQIWFYGDLFGSGYVIPTDVGNSGNILQGVFHKPFIWVLVLPHGFDAYTLIRNVYGYVGKLLAPWTFLAIVGFIHICIKKNQSFRRFTDMKIYSVYFLAVSLYLFVLYGSAGFFDNLASVPHTIGSSHTRYWLPIFVFAIPLCVRGILMIVYPLKTSYRSFVLLAVLVVLAFWSGNVVYKSPDGIHQLKENVQQFYQERKLVEESTEPQSVIVTPYADKYLYPKRSVLTTLDLEPQKAYEAIRRLQKQQIPVYYYIHTLSDETESQRRAVFADEGIILPQDPIFETFQMQLWRLQSANVSVRD